MMFNERLKLLREEAGMSQEKAAKGIGMALRNYQRLEKDGNGPNIKNLVQIAELFNVSIDYLMGRTDKREVNR